MAYGFTQKDFQKITDHIGRGGAVEFTTYTRATIFDAKNIGMLKFAGHSIYVIKNAKRQYCLNGSGVRFSVIK